MVINTDLSRKINILRFICICLVVLGHSSFVTGELYTQKFPIASSIQGFISGGITQPSVRLFFSISGFLFFQHIVNKESLINKLKRRVRTLIVPYILWNIIFVGYFIIMALIPQLGSMVNSNLVEELINADVLTKLYLLFVVPANGPLWFVRDLMIFVFLLSPCFFVIRHHKYAVLGGGNNHVFVGF